MATLGLSGVNDHVECTLSTHLSSQMSPEMNTIVTLSDLDRADDIVIMLEFALCFIATNLLAPILAACLYTFVFDALGVFIYLYIVYNFIAILLIAEVIKHGRDNSHLIHRILERALNKASKYDNA